MVEFVDLEFGAHGFLINHVFLPTEQAETNICWIIYQDAYFKICLSLFGWKENIVPKMHIVQWWFTNLLLGGSLVLKKEGRFIGPGHAAIFQENGRWAMNMVIIIMTNNCKDY